MRYMILYLFQYFGKIVVLVIRAVKIHIVRNRSIQESQDLDVWTLAGDYQGMVFSKEGGG